MTCGGIFAYWATGNVESISNNVLDFGFRSDELASSPFWRAANAIAMGISTLIVRHELLLESPTTKYGYAFGVTVGAILIPLIYVFGVFILFGSVAAPVVTSTAGRAWVTAVETSICLLLVRGRVSIYTTMVVIYIFVSQFHTIFPNISDLVIPNLIALHH